jgi:predicted DNA-binding protein (MmcQ/YjbR family)
MSADKKPAYRRDIEEYAREHFGSEVEHLWARSPSDGILRRKDNGKWYAVFMTVERNKLGLPGGGRTDIVNIKSSELLTGSLLNEKCIIPAYHMNKKKWLSVLLDGTATVQLAVGCLKMSYDMAAGSGKVRTEPKKWLIPANPSICDLDEVFANNRGETMWTQKASFIPGDTVYIYIASPVREIRYECKVLETDLSCDFGTGNGGERAMRLKQTKRYPDGAFGRERLSGFGISSVRGARGVPHSLACALEQG